MTLIERNAHSLRLALLVVLLPWVLSGVIYVFFIRP